MREGEKERKSVRKGVAERERGHRVMDGPHTHRDVRSRVVLSERGADTIKGVVCQIFAASAC